MAHFCVTWDMVRTVCSPPDVALVGWVPRRSSIPRVYALESTSPSFLCFDAQSSGDGTLLNNSVSPGLDSSRFRFVREASIVYL